MNKDLNNKIAELYFQNTDLNKAGKHWYLKPDKNERELAAVTEFERRLGHDPTLMLRKLINKQFFRFSLLDDFQIEQLGRLIEEAKEKQGLTPKFLRSLDGYIQKRRNTAANSGGANIPANE